MERGSMPGAPVVRVSLGWFPPERLAEVEQHMSFGGQPLGEAIPALPGLLGYWSGVDRERHAVVNVSLWASAQAAEQMATLQAMLDAGAALARLGVQFVRPIVNASTLWSA